MYSKVLDVMFALKSKSEDLFPTIILRMSGFHIDMQMLCINYNLFKRCGIAQLLSSVGLGGLGNLKKATLKKALTGGDVKEGINLHKNLCEALLEMKIKYIDVSKCDERKVVEIGYANKKEKNITVDELRKGVGRETFENVIASGNIESLSNSASDDMG